MKEWPNFLVVCVSSVWGTPMLVKTKFVLVEDSKDFKFNSLTGIFGFKLLTLFFFEGSS